MAVSSASNKIKPTPSPLDRQPRSATDDTQRTQSATCNMQHTMDNIQQTTYTVCIMEHATYNRQRTQSASWNMQHATYNGQHTTDNVHSLHHGTCNIQWTTYTVCNMKQTTQCRRDHGFAAHGAKEPSVRDMRATFRCPLQSARCRVFCVAEVLTAKAKAHETRSASAVISPVSSVGGTSTG